MPETTWSDKNMACIATYNILEGDQLLNQFDRVFLPFDKAGATKLSSLPYFPKFGGASSDIEGRSAQMARQFFKFLITLFTNRKERPADTIEGMLGVLGNLFASRTATIADLAKAADDFLKFRGEPGGPT
jgi:TorA maturation chaperone TorD